MSINYAQKYSEKVDERFTLASFTEAIVNQDYDWLGVEAIKVYSIPTVAVNDYTLSGSNRYGTPTELQNSLQTMVISQDKSFTFTIDKKSEQDTMGVMAAGQALRREVDEVIIPLVDKYRIATVVTGAPAGHIRNAVVTKANAYEEFLAVQEILDEAKVPQGGRVCLCTPAYHNAIKLDSSFTKTGDLATSIAIYGQVGEIDGVPVIKVPSSYFPNKVDFIITNKMAVPGPTKLVEYKIHDNAPGISGYLVEGRIRFDAFVLENKAPTIGVHMGRALSSIAITTAPTKTAYASGANFDPTGMVVKATYDDGTVLQVVDFTYSPSKITAAGNVTITYVEGGVTKTATQAVTIAS